MHRKVVVGLVAASVSAFAAPTRAQAQEAVITGRVLSDRGGQPVAGATVLISELGIGGLTNSLGTYTLTVPAARVRGQNVTLLARYIGFVAQRRQVTLSAGRQSQEFTLLTDANRLSEVVVTGVSVATERIKVPFAVTRIDSTQSPVPNLNPLSQLQGKVPGANIVAASGRPGAPPAVLLRGPKSLNATGRSQEPLYIVDGVILNNGITFAGQGASGGSIADINPQDIESIEVVKGAAAASLYGSQAANGVIQITTKRGRNAANGVRYGARTEFGVSDIEREFGIAQRQALLMDNTQTRFCITNGLPAAVQNGCYRTVDWLSENLRINDNALDYATGSVLLPQDPGSGLNRINSRRLFQTNPFPGANYDAIDQLARPQPLSITQADMTGKFGGTDVFGAINYTDQGGSIRYLNGYRRGSFRLNAGQQIGSDLQLNATSYFSRSAVDGFNQEGGGAAFFRLTRTPPIVDLTRTDSQGRLLIRTNIQGAGTQNENPLYSLQNTKRIDFRDRFIGALSGRYTPFAWLAADGQFGYDNEGQTGRQFSDRGFRTVGPSAVPANNGALLNYAQNNRSMNGSAGLTAPSITPFAKLTVSPSARVSYLQQDIDYREGQGTQLTVSGVTDLRNPNQTTLTALATRRSVRQLTYSGVLRLEYDDKYIVDGALRRDGNSSFGVENRWQSYGRIAGSWIASNEGWVSRLTDKIDLLKFSANYGTSGLAPNFNAQYETYTLGAGGSLTPATLGNRLLKPQIDRGSELIAEVGVFRDFNFTGTYALSHTFNQILEVNLPAAQRFQTQWQNVGTLQNKTVELSAAFPIFKRGTFNWSGRANFERTITKITQLDVPPYVTGGTLQATDQIFRIAKGERFGTFYGRKFITSCGELPSAARAACGGAGSLFQKNSDGFIVYAAGRGLDEGYSGNLWNTSLAGTNPVNPYKGVDLAWGHPIVLRDTLTNAGLQVPLGQALPKFRWSVNNTVNYKRLFLYGLVDASVGQSVYNQGRGWSYLDFLSADQDQANKSVGDVKPLSYYYRTQVENGNGAGGLYDILGPNNFFTEKASFAKLREVTMTYRLGRLAQLRGDWTVGLTGRNLYTWTKYKGFDPEVGLTSNNGAGAVGSGALTAVDAFGFPNLRTFSFNVAARF